MTEKTYNLWILHELNAHKRLLGRFEKWLNKRGTPATELKSDTLWQRLYEAFLAEKGTEG